MAKNAKQIAADKAREIEAAKLAALEAAKVAETERNAEREALIEATMRQLKHEADLAAAAKAWETRRARGDDGKDAARKAQATKLAKKRAAAIALLQASGAIS